MVLEKQDSGISLTTSEGTDIGRLDSTWSECGDLITDMDLLDDEEEPIKAHKKVCCALCRWVIMKGAVFSVCE